MEEGTYDLLQLNIIMHLYLARVYHQILLVHALVGQPSMAR